MTTMLHKERIDWVDIARGIAMLLVMIGHAPGKPEELTVWLYTFHVPLFFFLSGFVFSCEKYRTFVGFIKTRIQTLILPLACFTVLDSIWQLLLQPGQGIRAMLFRFAGIFVELRGSAFESQYWFICCLLIVETIYWIVYRMARGKRKTIVCGLILLGAIGFVYIRVVGKIVPWAIEASLLAVGFFGAGNLLREELVDNSKKREAIVGFVAFIISIVIVAVCMHYDFRNDLYANKLSPFFLYYFGAAAGIVSAISFSMILGKAKALQFIGRNSIIYYFLHKTVYLTFDKVLALTSVEMAPTVQLVTYMLLCCIILGVISMGVRKYSPWMLGRFKKAR